MARLKSLFVIPIFQYTSYEVTLIFVARHTAGRQYRQETAVRWLPFLTLFLLAWIEISLFVQVAHVVGVFMTLLLVIFTSVIGISLVKNQGIKNFRLLQEKLARQENPAAEMTKSVSLFIAGFLLILPGFFTDFIGLLLLLPPVQKHLTLKLMPYLTIRTMGGSTGHGSGVTVEGEFERREQKVIEHHDDEPRHH